jgi:hypothetical protein
MAPESLPEPAPAEERDRTRCRPDDVVAPDHPRRTLIIFALGHERFERRPDQTTRQRPTDQRQHLPENAGHHQPERQAHRHARETKFQSSEVAEALREAPALPRREYVNEPMHRREQEIVARSEAEFVPRQKDQVEQKECPRKAVDGFEGEVTELELARAHGGRLRESRAFVRNERTSACIRAALPATCAPRAGSDQKNSNRCGGTTDVAAGTRGGARVAALPFLHQTGDASPQARAPERARRPGGLPDARSGRGLRHPRAVEHGLQQSFAERQEQFSAHRPRRPGRLRSRRTQSTQRH